MKEGGKEIQEIRKMKMEVSKRDNEVASGRFGDGDGEREA